MYIYMYIYMYINIYIYYIILYNIIYIYIWIEFQYWLRTGIRWWYSPLVLVESLNQPTEGFGDSSPDAPSLEPGSSNFSSGKDRMAIATYGAGPNEANRWVHGTSETPQQLRNSEMVMNLVTSWWILEIFRLYQKHHLWATKTPPQVWARRRDRNPGLTHCVCGSLL